MLYFQVFGGGVGCIIYLIISLLSTTVDSACLVIRPLTGLLRWVPVGRRGGGLSLRQAQ